MTFVPFFLLVVGVSVRLLINIACQKDFMLTEMGCRPFDILSEVIHQYLGSPLGLCDLKYLNNQRDEQEPNNSVIMNL